MGPSIENLTDAAPGFSSTSDMPSHNNDDGQVQIAMGELNDDAHDDYRGLSITDVFKVLTPIQILQLKGANVKPASAEDVDAQILGKLGNLGYLPAEVRNQVYGYLLHNPELAKPSSISTDYNYGATMGYDLSANILRASKGIYEEALPILYRLNRFFISCVGGYETSVGSGGPHFALCPLTRYYNFESKKANFPSLRQITAFQNVRHWRVLVSALRNRGDACDVWNFDQFCRAIYKSAPESLEILVIPAGMEAIGEENFNDPSLIMQPLEKLRNVQLFALSNASFFDLPDSVSQIEDREAFPSHLPDEVQEVELRVLVTGNLPLEPLFKMHDRLLTYAQSFERFHPFKVDMGLGRGEELTPDHCIEFAKKYDRLPFKNPYKENFVHPVENALMDAKDASDSNDSARFKEDRVIVIQNLEEQYQRISIAARQLNDLIKEQKTLGGLFDPEASEYELTHVADCGQEMFLVEEYAAAFDRVQYAPINIRAEIRKQKRQFESHYAFNSREIFLGELNMAFENKDWPSFVTLFKLVVDDLDGQYIKILRSRKDLFTFDAAPAHSSNINVFLDISRCEELITKIGVDESASLYLSSLRARKAEMNLESYRIGQRGIDLDMTVDLLRSDDIVNWAIVEPYMGPEEGYNPEPYSESDLNDDDDQGQDNQFEDSDADGSDGEEDGDEVEESEADDAESDEAEESDEDEQIEEDEESESEDQNGDEETMVNENLDDAASQESEINAVVEPQATTADGSSELDI